jgi:hypothetical protein
MLLGCKEGFNLRALSFARHLTGQRCVDLIRLSSQMDVMNAQKKKSDISALERL